MQTLKKTANFASKRTIEQTKAPFSFNISLHQFKADPSISEDCESKESTSGWWGWLFGSNDVQHEELSSGCLQHLISLHLFHGINASHYVS